MESDRYTDTAPEAQRVQLALLRRAGPTRRWEISRSLSATVIELSRRALRAQMPSASEKEVLVRWVRLHYGDALGDGVARRLSQSL